MMWAIFGCLGASALGVTGLVLAAIRASDTPTPSVFDKEKREAA